MPNKVFVHKILDVIIPTLYVLNQLFFDQREKILIEKHIAFSVETYVLQIRITLIAVKIGTNLVLYLFKPLF